jgi:hypothetical protein
VQKISSVLTEQEWSVKWLIKRSSKTASCEVNTCSDKGVDHTQSDASKTCEGSSESNLLSSPKQATAIVGREEGVERIKGGQRSPTSNGNGKSCRVQWTGETRRDLPASRRELEQHEHLS